MRTKLFLAFLAIILTALVSNLIFKRLIIQDFEEYAGGVREDSLYWVLASVEGSFHEGEWDRGLLGSYLHWAAMLGYDVEVIDLEGERVLTSEEATSLLTPTMRRRMDAIVDLGSPVGQYEEYPLFAGGEEIGSLMVRPLRKKGYLVEKEAMFKRRGQDFLMISFLIAGGGALLLTLVLTIFLTKPIRRLKKAAEAVASGDLSVRVEHGMKDEIGRLTETFNHMVESLQREETLRQHLISNIAHELRTPLTVTKAHLEALTDGVVEPDEKEIKGLSSEIERLITLVEGIEDLTKAEASFFRQAEQEEVELRGLLKAITRTMGPVFSEKGLGLTFADREPLEVLTDAGKLETILRNIITNAVRHTDDGGVSLDWGKAGKERFFMEIRDTGRGIEEKDLDRIFDRFYKGEGSGGIGLGLAIAKELAGIMGGGIEVSTRPGEGAAFRVVLPMGR
jgi:two-component system sensor histidine kinase BaeS